MDSHSHNAPGKNAWRTRSATYQQDCPSRTSLTSIGEGARTLPMSGPYSGRIAPGFHGIPPRTRTGDPACHLRFPASSMRTIPKYPGLCLLKASGKSCAHCVPGHGSRPDRCGALFVGCKRQAHSCGTIPETVGYSAHRPQAVACSRLFPENRANGGAVCTGKF